tara:strand:- start:429 stop:1139 length:711 start_codon:yes stop_codon:yes gene_type:complete
VKKLLVCVGYDSREDIAYQVCRHSIYRRSTLPIEIYPLKHKELRDRGIFWRPWLTAGSGQTVDCIDGRPFSTAFSHTRFLTPHIAKERGYEWALFVDCDFLFIEDVAKLFAYADDKFSVMCRKFEYFVSSASKMDGMKQTGYDKKLWSSLCLWNTNSFFPTIEQVNSRDGAWLHQFKWLAEEQIGEIPEEWNWISGTDSVPKAIHFTEGGPWMPGYDKREYAHLWKKELDHMENSK